MEESNTQDRLAGLDTAKEPVKISHSYTRFIRFLRLALPIFGLSLIAVIFAWPRMEETVEPIAREELLPSTPIAQNELINPRYESRDDKKQPFTITAQKATQGQDNPEIIELESPTADLLMNDGSWLAAKANTGIYEQNSEKLFLNGNVRLFHDDGYQLESDEMRINLQTQESFSDKDVIAQGPQGTINAIGLEAYGADNKLIFKGPATMTLTDTKDTLDLGRAMP